VTRPALSVRAEPAFERAYHADECPDCGGPIAHGFGTFAGGLGPHAMCEAGCGWFLKRQIDTPNLEQRS
jgi:hypothetical protein